MRITIIVSAVVLMFLFAGCGDDDSGGGTTAPVVIPDIPMGLEVIDRGFVDLTLSWDSSDGATGYWLYFSDSETGTYTAVYHNSDTTSVDSNLVWVTTYYYKVSAENSAGESDLSAAISGTTDTPGGFTVSGSTSGNADYSYFYYRQFNGKPHYQSNPVGLNIFVPSSGDYAGQWIIHDQIEGITMYYHPTVTDYPSRNLWYTAPGGGRTMIILTPFAF